MVTNSDDQLKQLASRLDHIERILQSQIQRIHAVESRLGVTSIPVDPSVFPTTPAEPLPLPANDVLPMPSLGDENRLGVAQASSYESTGAPVPEAFQESLESKIGGNLLNKIGMAAIILGMAYFLKYAIDNEWIGEAGRVMVGVLTGLGFVAWGEWLHRKAMRGYAVTILGGGVAILYFSIFAAFSFYHLLDQIPALLLMVLITAATVVMSVRYDSKTIAIFATVGGFMTPALLSTGKDNQNGLFTYILLVDLGVLALAYFKNWRVLNLLAFFFTQLIFVGWNLNFYNSTKLWRTEFWLTAFFLLFAVMSFLYNITHQKKTTFRDLSLITLNGGCYFLWTYGLLESQYSDYLGFYAVLMAVVYVVLGSVAYRRAQEDSYLFLVFLGLGLTCLTVAIPIQLKQNWITVGWSVEAAVLTWVGFHLDSNKTRRSALLIVAMVVFRLLFLDSSFTMAFSDNFTFLFNKRGMAFLAGIASLFAMAYLYNRNREKLEDLERWLAGGLFIAANLLVLFFLTTEISGSFEAAYYRASDYQLKRDIRSRMQLSISALWGFYSIVLVTMGILRRLQPLRLLAILLFAATILKVFFVDLSEMEKIYRIIASIGLGVILLAVSMMYQRYRTQINEFVLK
jgi:uncharacterized membrane protein